MTRQTKGICAAIFGMVVSGCVVTSSAKGDRDVYDTASVRLESPVPVIGAWFPHENEMRNEEGYRDFLNDAATP